MTIQVTLHAPLQSYRRSRLRISCLCGWQTDWHEEIADARKEWAEHVAREQRYIQNGHEALQ